MARPGPTSERRESSPDGRVQRAARNRERIVEALLGLVREGCLMPTTEQVAARAGVGTRTVFRHFDDMETLYAEMEARVFREIRPLVDEPVGRGSLDERVRDLTRRRAAIFERVAPYKRSGNLQRWRSAFLQQEHANMVRQQRAELLRALPELEDAPDPVLEAFDLIASFESWNRLRTEQRLGRERAQAAVETALQGLARAFLGG